MDPLRVGDSFPDLTLESVDGTVRLSERWTEGPLVVAFMRHYGCPFCREHLILLGRAYHQIRGAGGDALAVFQYGAESTERFCISRGVPFDCLGDPARHGYRSVALGRGPRKEYLSLKVLRQRRRVRSVGARPGIPRGDVAQRPGTFVVDAAGKVVFAHYNEDSTDNAEVSDVLEAVETAAGLRQQLR
jgi:peroxiredoxin